MEHGASSPSTAFIKLSINGKFVNGISKATQRKGYFRLESEGARSTSATSRSWSCPGMATPEQTGSKPRNRNSVRV
jgi:hypothetical protein